MGSKRAGDLAHYIDSRLCLAGDLFGDLFGLFGD